MAKGDGSTEFVNPDDDTPENREIARMVDERTAGEGEDTDLSEAIDELLEYVPRPTTPELIKERTEFTLTVSYPDFSTDGTISPAFHDDLDQLRERFGEDNVLPSLYSDESSGKLELGLFIRETALPESD